MLIHPNYANPILTLANALSKRSIPFTLNVAWEGLQIRFPWNNGDLVCHAGSYGHEMGKLESMGCPWDGIDVSCLSVDEAISRIERWYGEVGA